MNFNQIYIKSGFIFVSLPFLLSCLFIINQNQIYFKRNQPKHNYMNSTKNILFFTTLFSKKDWAKEKWEGSEAFRAQGCPETNCYVTNNRAFLPIESYDAIVFHGRDIDVRDMPDQALRQRHQRYVYFTKESPANDYFDYKR